MNGPAARDFASLLFARGRQRGQIAAGCEHEVDPLEHLAYPGELELKSACLAEFWHAHGLPGQPGTLVPSPRPRGYRTTSKRRVVVRGHDVTLAFDPGRTGPDRVAASALEPGTHLTVYRTVHGALSGPRFRDLAERLNYVIVRGSYERHCVIFNVRALSRSVVLGLRSLAGRVQRECPAVCSAFAFVDPGGSDYYLETGGGAERPACKRLFGPRLLSITVGTVRYTFPPTVFSQVNESMLPVLIQTACELLTPGPNQRLLDLYCGYGLFACALAGGVAEVTGVEADGPAVAAAVENARHVANGRNMRFVAGRMGGELLTRRLPRPGSRPEIVLLDPPRNGVEPGVIEAVAARRPVRVLHIFCNADRIPAEVLRWRSHGYDVSRVAPLDMFPGTAGLETLVLLAPGKR